MLRLVPVCTSASMMCQRIGSLNTLVRHVQHTRTSRCFSTKSFETESRQRPNRGTRTATNVATTNKGLLKKGHSPFEKADEGAIVNKSPATALVTELKNQIHLRGPLSMAEWMQFCLGHPQHGYYMQRDAIGKKGDFITNPEISAVFSELLGVWCLTTWMKLGRPERIQIIECGPGRGTLMKDLLAAAERFPDFYNAISVHLVENSGVMRELQRQALNVELDPAVYDKSNSQDEAVARQVAATSAKFKEAREKSRAHLASVKERLATKQQELQRPELLDAQGNPLPNTLTSDASETEAEVARLMEEATRAVQAQIGHDMSAMASGAADPEQCAALHGYASDELDPRAVMTRPRVFGMSTRKADTAGTNANTETQTNTDVNTEAETGKDQSSGLFAPRRNGASTTLKEHLPVSWHWSVAEIPCTAPCIVLGHEFFDALPVHQFQYTERGWREILIDIDAGAGPHHFKYVLAPEATPASKAFATPMSLFGAPVADNTITPGNIAEGFKPSLAQSIGGIAHPKLFPSVGPGTVPTPNAAANNTDTSGAGAGGVAVGASHAPNTRISESTTTHTAFPGIITPAGDVFTTANSDARISAPDTAQTDAAAVVANVMGLARDARTPRDAVTNSAEVRKALVSPHRNGDTYEISPAALIWMEQVTLRLMKTRGAALFIDYGDNDTGFLQDDNAPLNAFAMNMNDRVFRELSVQGIKQHGHADVLQEPGLVDLSAHVNFGALGAVARRTVKQVSVLLNKPRHSREYAKALEMLRIPKNTGNKPKSDEAQPEEVGFGSKTGVELHNVDVYPAITQSAFLQQLGIEERFNTLLRNCKSEEEAQALFQAINRLVDPTQMGELFKVMAVMTKGTTPPVGWEHGTDDL